MKREGKIFLLTHLYPVFIVMHLQWGTGERISTAIFHIVPILFVSLLLALWSRTSHVRLSHGEKTSIALFIYFFVIVHVYYALCALIYQTAAGKVWILDHNLYIVYFILFIFIFYAINRAKQQWGQ